jgi:hypothetical protein
MTNEKRDATIFKLWQRGWTYQRIAERYGVTTHRINQIIADQKAINAWGGSTRLTGRKTGVDLRGRKYAA